MFFSRNFRSLAAATLLPLTIAACGDSEGLDAAIEAQGAGSTLPSNTGNPAIELNGDDPGVLVDNTGDDPGDDIDRKPASPSGQPATQVATRSAPAPAASVNPPSQTAAASQAAAPQAAATSRVIESNGGDYPSLLVDNTASDPGDDIDRGPITPTAQAGKDQVGPSAATGASSKLTDTTPTTDRVNAPTEKTDAATDAATQAAAPAAPLTINSIDAVVGDMGLLNDAPLAGVDPSFGFAKGPGFNVMGNNANSASLPAWYTSEFPELADSGTWNAVLPWFVLFEGENNQASNVRVQMRELKVFVLSRQSNEWQQVVAEQGVDGEFCPNGDQTSACSANSGAREESSGGVSFVPLASHTFHGWFGERASIDGDDVKAVFVTMQSRVVSNDASQVDDRDLAQYLIDVGADYYPDVTTDLAFVPGVGVSRAKLLSSDWKSFSFMTFSDVGKQEPGGGITEAEFRTNPPPLD